MEIERRSVGSLWVGDPIGIYECLSLSSFARQGHETFLYAYSQQNALPPSVALCDAREVAPGDAIFNNLERSYSFAMFSDWFRYRMIQQKGHVWADTDLVCLTPLPDDDPLFAWNGPEELNGALLYAGPSSGLIAELVRRTEILTEPNARNVSWGTYGPELLTTVAREMDLTDFALAVEAVYPIGAFHIWRMFDPEWKEWCLEQTADATTLHLWNSKIQKAGVKGLAPPAGSFLDELMQQHGIEYMGERMSREWVRETRRKKEGLSDPAIQRHRDLLRRAVGRLRYRWERGPG